MKRTSIFIMLFVILAIAFCAGGCIFDSDKEDNGGGSNALIGTWEWPAQGTSLSTLTLYDNGRFNRFDYEIGTGGSRTEKWSGGGVYDVELKKDGFEADIISLNFWGKGTTNVVSTTRYPFSVSGNKLTLSGTVLTRK